MRYQKEKGIYERCWYFSIIWKKAHTADVGIQKSEKQPPKEPKNEVPGQTVFYYIRKYKWILIH